jgi:hypothetical protein
MKKIFGCIFLILTLLSCNRSNEDSLVVTGSVDGLKKGTLYLQKFVDTVLVTVDSISLNGKSEFTLTDNLSSPEIYFITLDKISEENISFFAEKGEIQVNTKLSKFATSVTIAGSRNQELLEEHNSMTQKFNGQQLDFVKDRFEAQQKNDTALLSKIDVDELNLLKRKMLFTTNFSVNHGDAEVAPYLALTELYYANIKLLDTVNKSLTPDVKASKYGRELEKLIQGIKKSEEE